MIVQCPDCSTRYQLDPDRVPRQKIRARCPQCRYVFAIDGTLAPRDTVTATGVSASVTPVSPAPAVTREAAPVREPMATTSASSTASTTSSTVSAPTPPAPAPSFDLEIERHHAAAPRPAAPRPVEPEAEPERAPQRPAVVATVAPPEPAEAAGPTQTDAQKKARRLARALVSDILVYNRELRDKSLAEGNLVQALGHEIKKSYELFKERVGPEVENPRQFFVEALNDILADGQKVF